MNVLFYLMSIASDGTVEYVYYPDGNKDFEGHVFYNPNTNDFSFNRSGYVYDDEYSMFPQKVLHQIMDSVKEGDYRESGYLAWG